MNDNDRRNINDFYAHRALVLKRIQQALAAQRNAPNARQSRRSTHTRR